MTWWDGQSLDKTLHGKDGRLWHFQVWHGHIDGIYVQRIFFWDDQRQETGFAEFSDGHTLYVTKIKQRMRKIVNESAYREKFRRDLRFPLERHYS